MQGFTLIFYGMVSSVKPLAGDNFPWFKEEERVIPLSNNSKINNK